MKSETSKSGVATDTRLRLAVVIPALNEEGAIGSTLERALAARKEVVAQTPIDEMLIVFVNDGSTDGTQSVAEKFADIISLQFERNRGYGAAIKAGFAVTDAEIVGFMDADGTCDPLFFSKLVNELVDSKADVVSGNRMTAESEMPRLRRFGNFLFAKLILAVSGKRIKDSASGMRVIARSSLHKLHPLPDGLHYTPAMTSLALMDPRLTISEVDMPYKERVGESKLHVLKDGMRFLGIILFTFALFNPLISLTILGSIFLLAGLAVCGIASHLGQDETSILILFCAFFAVSFQAVFIGFLCHQMLHMLLGLWDEKGKGHSILKRFFWTKKMVWAGSGLLGISLMFLALTPLVDAGWRWLLGIVSALGVLISGWLALGGVILRVIWAAKEKRIAERLGMTAVPTRPEYNPVETTGLSVRNALPCAEKL